MDALNSSDCFPAGLRVLVVDDDPICLLIIERLLRSCLYQVTTCGQAVIALSLLREDSSRFDVVLSDVHMPDMDGFKLLELVQLEMDLPVIMMSANGETSNVMKGISQGACDYLLKPVRLEELQNIWQHVVRKKHKILRESDNSVDSKEHQRPKQMQTIAKIENASGDEANGVCSSQRKRRGSLGDDSGNEEDEHLAAIKRQRVVWSEELHQKFISAINHLGLEQAVPKRILDLMNVPGLTRENVASHLQKYRLYLKRMTGSVNQQFSIPGCLSPPGRFMHSFAFMKGLQVSESIGQFPNNSLLTANAFKSESTDNEVMSIIKAGADPHIECNGSNGPMLAQYLSSTVQGKLAGAVSPKHLKDTCSISSGQSINLPQHNSEILLLQRNVALRNSRNVVINSMPHAGNNQLLVRRYDGPQHG